MMTDYFISQRQHQCLMLDNVTDLRELQQTDIFLSLDIVLGTL